MAKEQGLPAYVIFHDATLREIATRRPAGLAELGTISGIGEAEAGAVRRAGPGRARPRAEDRVLGLADDWAWDSWPAFDGDDLPPVLPARAAQPRRPAAAAPQRPDRACPLHRPAALDPAPDPVGPGPSGSFDEVACWTGCTVPGPDGRWRMFYTGLTDVDGSAGRAGSGSASRSPTTWSSGPGPTCRPLTPIRAGTRWPGRPGGATRPGATPGCCPTRPATAGTCWSPRAPTPTGRRPAPVDRGVIGHARSPDLRTWTVRPPLSAPGAGFGHLEVVQVFAHAGRTHLVFSCLPRSWPRGAAAGVTGGHWIVPDIDPAGPYDVSAAVPLTGDDWYAGRVV